MIYTYSPNGSLGAPVCVEVDARAGIPGIDIVGLPGVSVREARERIRFSLENSCIPLKQRRILINLSPADLPKKGSGFDLPMALALIESQNTEAFADTMVLGELSLSGDVLPVSGESAAFVQGWAQGIRRFLFPSEIREPLPQIPGARIARANTLLEAMDIMVRDNFDLQNDPGVGMAMAETKTDPANSQPKGTLRSEVNQEPKDHKQFLWDGLEIDPMVEMAVMAFLTGDHSMLLVGPPGAGKSYLAAAIRELRGKLDFASQLEVATIWSQAGQPCSQLFTQGKVPWRQPHHSATREGLIGGGKMLVPGEMSLAHRGILFLDECLEFTSHFLQNLRQPLEEGVIRHSRAGKTHTMAADFQLILACNPCPCGYYGSDTHNCVCSAQDIHKYWSRINGPLLDRIDIRLWIDGNRASVPSIKARELEKGLEIKRTLRKKLGSEDSAESQKAMVHGELSTSVQENLSRRGLKSLAELALTLAIMDGLSTPEKRHFHHAGQFRTRIGGKLNWL